MEHLNAEDIVGKNILFRRMSGTGYGKVDRVSAFDSYNVVVNVKLDNGMVQTALVNLKDIIKVYG